MGSAIKLFLIKDDLCALLVSSKPKSYSQYHTMFLETNQAFVSRLIMLVSPIINKGVIIFLSVIHTYSGYAIVQNISSCTIILGFV